jgi:hypothetical protein
LKGMRCWIFAFLKGYFERTLWHVIIVWVMTAFGCKQRGLILYRSLCP